MLIGWFTLGILIDDLIDISQLWSSIVSCGKSKSKPSPSHHHWCGWFFHDPVMDPNGRFLTGLPTCFGRDFLPWFAMPQGFHWQVVPADLHGHWVLEVFFCVASFFWGFHGVPKLAGCLSSWENPHWNGWWLGVPIKKSRVNLMKLDETQDIGNRNRVQVHDGVGHLFVLCLYN